MSLRTKSILANSLTILLLTVFLYLFSARYWLFSLTSFEEQNTLRDLARVEYLLNADLEALNVMAGDWAAWDDTYTFMQDRDAAYIRSNLVPGTYRDLFMDIVAMVSPQGEVVYGKQYDSHAGTLRPLPADLQQNFIKLATSPPLTESAEWKGFMQTGDKILMFAARPILTSMDEGPARGVFIFGRFLGKDVMAELHKRAQTDFQLTPVSGLPSSGEIQSVLETLLREQKSIARVDDAKTISAYRVINDYHGQPVLLLQVKGDRFAYTSGLKVILVWMVVSLAVGLISMIISSSNINRYLLRRIYRLHDFIQQVAASGNLDLRLFDTSPDELGTVIQGVNQMLDKLSQSQAEVTQAQAELTSKADLLAEMNQALEAEIEERKEMEGALRVKSEQQQKLFAAAHQLSGSLDVEVVLQDIARGAREILQADGCVIYLLQEDKRTLKPVVAIEESYEEEILSADLDIDQSLTGKAIKARRGMIFNDAASDEDGFQVPGTPVEVDERVIAAPLFIGEEVVGAVVLDRNRLDFSQDELQLAETFAAYASTALKNARAHEMLQKEIQERLAAESALQASEARYQQLVNNLPIGLYRTSPEGKLLFANPALHRLFAFDGREIPEDIKVADFFVHPQDWDAEREYVDRDGVVRGYEMQMRRMDGSVFWVKDTFQAVFDHNGDLMYYEGSLEDITEKKRAEYIQQALYDIAQAALTSPDLKALFNSVHEVIGRLMPAQNFYIALYDAQADLLKFPYFVDQFDSPPDPRPMRRGLTEYVIRQQKGILVDTLEFEEMEKRGEVEAIGSPSLDWLGVPLVSSSGKALGAMVVQTYDEKVRYSSSDLHVLSIISAQVALAIERKTAEEELRHQRAYLRQVIDINPNFIFVKDREGRYTLANQAIASAYGTSVEEMLGKTDAALIANPAEAAALRRDDLEVIQSRKEKIIPLEEITDAHGKRRWMQTVKRPLIGFGEGIQVLGVATDVTERKLAEDQLSHNAFHDSLTGLPNRLLFMDRLSVALNRSRRKKEQQWFAVLFLDMDRFKTINDTLGHVLGDQFLVMAARRLQACIRASDTIARFGGDEFVILLEDLNETSEAVQIAERILVDLSASFNLAGHEVSITASIGIVLSSSGYEKGEEILRDADIAMYRAKALGRNRYVIFNSDMRASVVQHLELEKDLRNAIENHQLELHYQPITSIKTRKIIGFEALVRWRHPEKGLISPADFIPFAEETGLILPMGEWVLREACRQLSAWQKKYPSDPPLTVSVNLSNKQFSQPDLFEQVESALRESRLDASSLQLEITESVIMENAELTIATLDRLVAMGVKIHVDDFGTGYSSLAYLHLLPIDAIKIDRSFISGPSVQGNGMEIAQTIVSLAHDLHIDAIAEGVETEEQWQKLDEWSCEYAQGYLIARVLDPQAAESLLSATITRRDGESRITN
ncbi:MAG: EAL domain-containing protein [Chloroflexota bacterium]